MVLIKMIVSFDGVAALSSGPNNSTGSDKAWFSSDRADSGRCAETPGGDVFESCH